MRVSEIIVEDASGDALAAHIASLLSFVRTQYSNKGLTPKIKTASFINLVKRSGFTHFTYEDLVVANEIPTIKNLVQSFNKDEIILNSPESELDVENKQEEPAAGEEHKLSPEETVSQMAKRSLNKRS
jgi:division protein CdvB (Snf7/Vps24/ESCRT-III family)